MSLLIDILLKNFFCPNVQTTVRGGGVGRLMANAILNFHFDYRHPSLSYSVFNIIHTLINQSCDDIMFTRRMTLPRISAKLNRC